MAADELAFFLRVGNALQFFQVALLGIDPDDADTRVLREGLHHLVALVKAQQAGVDEGAGELAPDGLVHQRRGDRGIHPAG